VKRPSVAMVTVALAVVVLAVVGGIVPRAGARAVAAEQGGARFGTERECTGQGTCVPSGLVEGTLEFTDGGGDCVYAVTIDWGDGSTSEYRISSSAVVRHQYTKPGVYTETVTGTGSSPTGAVCNATPATLVNEVPAPARTASAPPTERNPERAESGSSAVVVIAVIVGALAVVAVALVAIRSKRSSRRADRLRVALRPDHTAPHLEPSGPLQSIAIRLDTTTGVATWRETATR
jgi:hypothetical protein